MFEELNSQIDSKLTEIASIQASAFSNDGKYERISKIDLDDFSYLVIEYKTPKGEFGYQVNFEKIDNGKTYVKSVGYGVESEHRTRCWKELINEEE